MKKLFIMLVVLIALFSFPVHAKTYTNNQMTVKTVKNGKHYKAKVYWKGKKVATYKFKKKPVIKFVKHDKLTRKKLCNRKNKVLLIEILTGTVIDDKGNGKVDTVDPYYNYIHYNGFKIGDKVKTFCIFNPYNNGEDDIVERFDVKVK